MPSAPTGKTLAFSTCVLLLLLGVGAALYRLLPPEPRWHFQGPNTELIGLASHPRILTWERDGKRLSQFKLHDARTFRITPILAGCVIEKPSSRLLIETSANGEWLGILDHSAGKLWVASVHSGQERCVAVPKNMRSILAISCDGRMAALGTEDADPGSAQMAVLDLHTGATVLQEADFAYSAFFAGGGKFFVANFSECLGGKVLGGKVWDTASGRCVLERPNSIEQMDTNSDALPYVWVYETSLCLWNLETQSAVLQFTDWVYRFCGEIGAPGRSHGADRDFGRGDQPRHAALANHAGSGLCVWNR